MSFFVSARPSQAIARATAAFVATALVATILYATASADDAFEQGAGRILIQRCVECHGDREPSGNLRLTTAAGLRTGGDSGPAVDAEKPGESLLLQRVIKGEMPPPRQGHSRKLPEAEIAALRDWLAAGAKWPDGRRLDLFERTNDSRAGRDWWSLQPLVGAVPPDVRDRTASRTTVDAFILAGLERADMRPAPAAPPRELLRRLSFDLHGLPPAAEELDDFASDAAVDAYERQVDRLLASPRFGERWGRHWLDLARYAETSGYERDQEKPFAWKYRDWVIRAVNEDLPYDEFIRQQLAGDELTTRSESTVVATGFLRLGTWNDEPNDPQEYKYERMEDLVDATCTAFLALTVKCARCHDHKFDPIPQADYYRLASAFWAGPIEPRGRELLGGPTRDELGFDVLGWTDVSASPTPLNLLKKGDPRHQQGAVSPGFLSLMPALAADFHATPAGSRTTLRRSQIAERIVAADNPLTPRVAVNRIWLPHFGRGLVRSPNNFGFTGERPTHPELLDYLAIRLREDGWRRKPLHRLLVTSATYRQATSHPEQQAYEERDFDNRGWWRFDRRRLDAESLRDSLLAASGRLDLRTGGPSFKPVISAEALEGLSRKTGAWQASPPSQQGRRSVYIYSQRSLLPPLLTVFDVPDTTLPCGQRDVSTVAPQALALLNNEFVHEQSRQLAERVIRVVRGQATQSTQSIPPSAQFAPSRTSIALTEVRHQDAAFAAPLAADREIAAVQVLWRLALSRDPSAAEVTAARTHLARQRKHFGEPARRPESPAVPEPDYPRAGLVLRLAADEGVQRDANGRIERWKDLSPGAHHAEQTDAARRPEWIEKGLGDKPAARFDGHGRFLSLAGQVLSSQQFSILAAVADHGPAAHREIFSNWNGAAGNSVSSVFFGLTNKATVRLSDDFVAAGPLADVSRPMVLTAVAGRTDAAIWQNGQEIARKGGALAPRVLTTGYVVGQQGNIEGEYWTGEIAELLVYDRELKDEERKAAEAWLGRRYGVPTTAAAVVRSSPERLAWESLCHVLLNCNEFLYVD